MNAARSQNPFLLRSLSASLSLDLRQLASQFVYHPGVPLIFNTGSFPLLLLGFWGGYELLVDTLAKASWLGTVVFAACF